MRAVRGRALLPCLLALVLAACAPSPRLAGVATRVADAATSLAAVHATPTPPPGALTPATATSTTTAKSPAGASPERAAATPTAAPAVASTTSQRSSSRSATAATALTSSRTETTGAPEEAVKAVIQRGNEEQARAFAARDDTLMRDTATSGYYDQLVQTARDMEDSGVSAIALVKLEWGPVTLQGGGRATATTFETWQTTYADGHSDQSRDRNVYTLVQQSGAWKIEDDAHPDAEIDPTAPAGDPGQPPDPLVPLRPGESHNWSGYAASGGSFTAVTGTWTVPTVAAGGGLASDATWVGIGGVNTRDLIQAGTEATVTGSGRVRYEAWLELLPRTSRPVALTVSPGDVVTVSVARQPSGDWSIAFQDATSGQSYRTSVTYDSSLSSAEWVEEAPSGGRRLLTLDNFGTVQFSGGSAVKDGKTVTIAQAGGRPVTMVDRSDQPLATPSALNAAGNGFSVRRAPPAGSATTPAPSRRGSGAGQ